jgi:hypothetical protein
VAGKIGTAVAREIREAVPPAIFFLLLFHMLGLTRAVAVSDHSFTALRAASATVAALIVAKAILVVEALPLARLFSRRRIAQVLWKTLLYGAMVLLFRLAEELIPLAWKHGGLAAGIGAMSGEIAWPLFAVQSLWVVAGLFLYCLAAELVSAIGPRRVRELLFGVTSS